MAIKLESRKLSTLHKLPYHGIALRLDFFSLYLFSLRAIGGAFSPSSAKSSRVIPSFKCQKNEVKIERAWKLTWPLFRDFLLLCRSWLPICGQIEHVANIRGGHDAGCADATPAVSYRKRRLRQLLGISRFVFKAYNSKCAAVFDK